MAGYLKQRMDAPPGFFALEAAGLRWLNSAAGGVRCVEVLSVTETSLELEPLSPAPATAAAAAGFGRGLAALHDAGAPAFGAGPAGWSGEAYFGPLESPLPMSLTSYDRWGDFYAHERLEPMLDRALREGNLDAEDQGVFDAVVRRLEDGEFDDDDLPARIHGDLWSGNVMWTPDGAVLIDPAAHGGHRETDLAMLELFGLPYLEVVLEAYESVHPLPPDRLERVRLHQLYPLLVHAVLFGGGYVQQTMDAARAYVK